MSDLTYTVRRPLCSQAGQPLTDDPIVGEFETLEKALQVLDRQRAGAARTHGGYSQDYILDSEGRRHG